MRKGAMTGPAIEQAFRQVHDFQGATGNTTFDDHGDVVSKPFVRMTIKNGQVVPFAQ
jgi:ABC-type branched-subunit amino acid transport system substrate-binding protein